MSIIANLPAKLLFISLINIFINRTYSWIYTPSFAEVVQMLDKILGKKDKDKNDTPDLRKNGKKSDSDNSDIGGRLKDMVGKVSGKSKDDS